MKRFSLALTAAVFLIILVVLFWLILYPPFPALVSSLASSEIRFAIVLSLVTSTISTAICVAIAIPVAYALARYEFPFKKIISLFLTIPLALPPLVAGIALLLFFGASSWGKALEAMGFEVVFTPLGIIVAEVFVNLPYLIRILKSSYTAVNPRYENVAKTLGCSETAAFMQVTLPLIRPGIIAGTSITWAKSMGEFGAVLMLAGATMMRTETLPIALYLNISTGDLDLAVAASVILILISLSALFVVEHFSDESHVF
ncbi:MAG: ABC transporter permease [Methanoregula sp.]|jgi:molybdate transport system permease protein